MPEEECCIRSQLLIGVAKNLNDDDYDITCIKHHVGGPLEMESIEDMSELASKTAGGLSQAIEKRLKTEEKRKLGHSFLL
ncbi:hypothetical protein B9Z55_021906 [Caenorhabditis nigoni]|uniref:Uncharacterized protein n=1 Tax=Caenorhabditis nigoni TaxID=1611254 RepID=A0A2G5TU01_9PELO|nr:hypothetical protein B9Z55_021906 [Caenorhabditis nigoni]